LKILLNLEKLDFFKLEIKTLFKCCRPSARDHPEAPVGTGGDPVAHPLSKSHRRRSLRTQLASAIKTCFHISMSAYKRNQVEEAIATVLERTAEPSTDLRTRLKRLLDFDRSAGRNVHAKKPENATYAFYSADSPGSGVEVWFSAYEAFALITGLALLRHGWPQGFVVSLMRRVRPSLEKEHARILKQDPKTLFDLDAIRRTAKAGDMAFNNTDPVLLTIVSKFGVERGQETEPYQWAICRGPAKTMEVLSGASGGTSTMFEIVGIAHQLANALGSTEPQPRGRT
jgi:hypothetical protein